MAGSSSFTVQVTDGQAPADVATGRAVDHRGAPRPSAEPAYSLTTTSLPNAKRNKNYSRTLQASGGTTPYLWSLAGGSLPPGLTLSATGVISGRATTLGLYSFTVGVQDSQATPATDTAALSIRVTR